jgi:hypothetical protein
VVETPVISVFGLHQTKSQQFPLWNERALEKKGVGFYREGQITISQERLVFLICWLQPLLLWDFTSVKNDFTCE